jgi:hypothetical protein
VSVIAIEMRGRIEPVVIKMDFATALNRFNLSAANGNQFVLLEKDDDRPIGLYIPNIMTFEEISPEDDYVA